LFRLNKYVSAGMDMSRDRHCVLKMLDKTKQNNLFLQQMMAAIPGPGLL